VELNIQPERNEREFDLEGIVPWGRQFDEYEAFFALECLSPGLRILDVGGGPASFAAEACERGLDVMALDPIYALSREAIEDRFEATALAMRRGIAAASYRFNWKFYGSEDGVHFRRRAALASFLSDFERKGIERYVVGALPTLPFNKGAFDLALSSHLLFLYGDELNCEFHIAAMRELMRIAREVRVFPLLNLDGRPSSHLPVVMRVLEADGFNAELTSVDFEFQKGATKMLRVWRD
jgi:SAM-dependent methyltransferase